MADASIVKGQDSSSLAYPLTKMNFFVKVGTFSGNMAFTEITGVDATVDVIDFRQGNSPSLATSKIPGLVKHSNVTMKYGLITGSDIRDWIVKQIGEVRADYTRQDITIEILDIINLDSPSTIMTDVDAAKGKTWILKNAFIASYKGADLDAKSSEVAVETIEIAYEKLVIDNTAMATG